MAAMKTTANNLDRTPSTPGRTRACFSFAAYAKILIAHLKANKVAMEEGLTEAEFQRIESTLHFPFPPDLRVILSEGLPVGRGFPNWRTASTTQLRLLAAVPTLSLIGQTDFWFPHWGPRPRAPIEAQTRAARALRLAPLLVPVYGHFYIPSIPSSSGNPVFSVSQDGLQMSAFDLAGFFQGGKFPLCPPLAAPAWAASAGRRIVAWSYMEEYIAQRCRRNRFKEAVKGSMERISLLLKGGGWKEEEVEEMITQEKSSFGKMKNFEVKEDVLEFLCKMSSDLLRGGWSVEDVVYSLGVVARTEEDGSVVEQPITSLNQETS